MNPFIGKRVLVVGEVCVDKYLSGHSTRQSPEADVPVITNVKESWVPGMTANVYENLIRLGAIPTLKTISGADVEGGFLERHQERFGGLLVDSRPTITKTRVISNGKQVARIDVEDVTPFPPAIYQDFYDSIVYKLEDYDAVILQDYGKGLWTGELLQRFIAECNTKDLKVFVDPYPKHRVSDYRGCYLIKPNDKEARLMTPDTEIHEYYFQEQTNCDWVVITSGGFGMAALGRDYIEDCHYVPTIPLSSVVDITGAGDTVLSVLCLSLISGMSIIDACQLANKAAGKVVSTGKRTVTWEDLE